ncbi:hypothetical protein DFJ74DRAFT_690635 [Hyaloraphidium curvatum]|nr:hypothetical protein DFJ74DRAFT_690635 [Hyaloraphidium curvatum]
MPRPTSIDASSNDDADSTGDTCIVCWDAARTHSLFPCGHRSYCAACATAIMSSGDKKCSVCRQTVLGAARVYV